MTAKPDPSSLISLAEKIEDAGNDFAALADEIRDLQAALRPGISVADANARVAAASTRLEKPQKRINHANSQFKKELDNTVPGDVWATRIQPTGPAAHQALLSIICRHFERQGFASVAREMISEDEQLPEADLGPSLELQTLLQCLEPGVEGFAPVAAWADANSAALARLESPLPSYIIELSFFQALTTRGDADALAMLRNHYTQQSLSTSTIERLAGAIPLLGTPSWAESQSYIDTLRRQAIAALIRNFWQLCPTTASEDALVDTLEASIIAYPVLDRLGKVLSMTPWSSDNELPAEIPLPDHLQFHPIFVCPVLKEQASDEPPKLLPCGHVLSCDAFAKLSKSQSQLYIKCPYCPKSFGLQEARDVRFIRKK